MVKSSNPYKGVGRIKLSASKYLHDVEEFLLTMLEYIPPVRRGRYKLHLRVRIEELNEGNEVVGSFEFERTSITDPIG